jgi:hypothetical protein
MRNWLEKSRKLQIAEQKQFRNLDCYFWGHKNVNYSQKQPSKIKRHSNILAKLVN